MSDRHDVDRTMAWMRAGTEHLIAVVAGLGDADLHAPSALPGWTRAHVVGHVARNAEALGRLVSWARTGVETPMYTDREQRAAEIERSAALPAAALRDGLTATAAALDGALGALSPADWHAQVRSALGRAIPAAELPWMRIREVWLHAVDLRAGATVDDLPRGVVDLLLDDVTAALSAKDGCPSLAIAPTDRERTWTLGAHTAAGSISGTAAELAGWLTGRVPAADRPTLPHWL